MQPRLLVLAAAAALALIAGTTAASEQESELWSHVRVLFPNAHDMDPLAGRPPVAKVYAGDRVLGFVFLTDRIYPIPAYSGKPVSSLVGIDPAGVITGVRIVHHVEPILLAGVDEEDLAAFVEQYKGLSSREDIRIEGIDEAGRQVIDGITGATITVMVINASVARSLKRVLPTIGIR